MTLRCVSCRETFSQLHPKAGVCFPCYQVMKRSIPHKPEDYV